MALELVEKQQIYSGKRIRLEVQHFQDESGRRVRKEVCVHPGAVAILPFLDSQTILLIRNKRHAIGQILIEIPAGTLEKDEDPMNCAGRELLEETGYLAGRVVPLTTFFTSPGILSEKMYVFAAYDLERSVQALEADEEIEVMPVSLRDAVLMIQSGEITDGKTIATLLYYDRFGCGSRLS